MAIGRFYYLVDSYRNSSTGLNRQAVHILPHVCWIFIQITAKEGNLSIFSSLRSRKFTVPAGKKNNNCKDTWICFCNRSFGGRPVTVPGWRSTHSKESTTSVAKPTAFFLLCFPLKTLQQNLLCIPFIDKEVIPVE